MMEGIRQIIYYRPFTIIGLQAVCFIADDACRKVGQEEIFGHTYLPWGLSGGLTQMVGFMVKTGELREDLIHQNNGTFAIYCNPTGETGFTTGWHNVLAKVLYQLNGYGERAILSIANDRYDEWQASLPTLSELRGILNEDATEGLSPEEYVRKLRNEWDDNNEAPSGATDRASTESTGK